MAQRLIERAAWVIGVVALTVWAIVWAAGKAGARQELDWFAALDPAQASTAEAPRDARRQS